MKKPSISPLISHRSVRETSGSVRNKIGALLIALGLGTAVMAYGSIRGFNNDPRANHENGIELTDKKANRRVMCLRELFNDIIKKPLFKNKWRAENCDEAKMEELSKPPNQLRKIVDARKDVFIEQGIGPATETWLNKKGQMKINIDENSKEAGINAGKIKE